MKRFTALLLLFVSFASTLAAADFGPVDREIETLMQQRGVPGAAVVIVKDGKVVHSRAFGVTSVETAVPVTPKTLFRLGSTAKLFTALAAMRLADEGRLKLSQPVGELVPDLPAPFRALTMEQLLTHTAGLSDEAPMTGPLEESAMHERVLGWTEAKLFTAPGEVFSYSNIGYVLAGEVVARIAGKPFSSAVHDLVLSPMGMGSASYRPLDAFSHPVALGHDRGEGDKVAVMRPVPEHAGNYPPGSLFTSIEELGSFLSKLTPEMLARLASPRALIPAQARHYGYGLIVDGNRGAPVALHTGARAGYGSVIMFLPAEKVAVAVVANRSGAIFSSAAFVALDLFAATPLSEPARPAGDLPIGAAEAMALAGTYLNGELKVELAVQDGGLVVKFAGRSMKVQRTGPWSFHVDQGRQLENFIIIPGEDGRPRFLAAETWALRKRS